MFRERSQPVLAGKSQVLMAIPQIGPITALTALKLLAATTYVRYQNL